MTYTAQQLHAMSDFERNKAIALKLYPNATVVRSMHDDESVTIIVAGEFTKIMVDYCNNPNDIMPLAFERKIGVDFIDGFGWTAEYFYSDISFSCYDKPLRAIACLLLMMED